MTAGPLHIGTSGWNYPWSIYRGVPQRRRLERYAELFDAVEVNGTFYRLQKAGTIEGWVRRTPSDFVFACKAHRYLTHHKRLLDPAEPIVHERERAARFGSRLRVVLWQLPANLRREDARLDQWLRALERWPGPRHAFEPRHPSWMEASVERRLADAGVAAVQSDAPGWPLWSVVTTDLVYVRLHGHTRLYRSRYATPHLRRWAERVERWRAEGREVHVYFDNTAEEAAPRDVARLRQLLSPAR